MFQKEGLFDISVLAMANKMLLKYNYIKASLSDVMSVPFPADTRGFSADWTGASPATIARPTAHVRTVSALPLA